MIEEYALRRGARALLVVTDGRLAGIVTLSDLHKLPPERWSDTTVGQIMTPVPLVTVEPNADLQSALRLMGQRDLNQLPVVDHGTLVGLLTRSNVIRYLHFRDELGAPPPTIGARGEGERRRAA
jgi:CBS domain-containing protein